MKTIRHRFWGFGTESKREMESSGWNTTWETFLDEQLYRLAQKRLRLGYYSCTMERDCIHFLQRCHKCQVHANLIYASPTELHNQTTPWPFAVYCLDLIGRLTRRQPIGHEYILVAIDSFRKWEKNLLHHDHSGTRHNISEEAASHS